MNRFQVSTFGSIAIVFAVIGVNDTIFSGVPVLDAVATGWLILAIVDILWVLYFTSEEDSLALYIFNSMGTGGLTPPSRRRRTMRTQPSVHNMSTNNGYAANYASGGGIGSHDAVPYDGKIMGSPMGGGGGGSTAIRSQNSFVGGQSMDGAARSIGGGTAAGSINAPGGENRSIGGGDAGSPLIGGGNAGVGAGGGLPGTDPLGPDSYSYKAKALYACESLSVMIVHSFCNLFFPQTLRLQTTRTKFPSRKVKCLTLSISKGSGGRPKKQTEQ
jgi:SHO1 osmosensor